MELSCEAGQIWDIGAEGAYYVLCSFCPYVHSVPKYIKVLQIHLLFKINDLNILYGLFKKWLIKITWSYHMLSR